MLNMPAYLFDVILVTICDIWDNNNYVNKKMKIVWLHFYLPSTLLMGIRLLKTSTNLHGMSNNL